MDRMMPEDLGNINLAFCLKASAGSPSD